MFEDQTKYIPDWRVDSIDEGKEAAEKAESDYSDRDRPRRASSSSDYSIYRYEDND